MTAKTAKKKGEIMFQRLVEITTGAVRHVMEKHAERGYMPVGFSVILYNASESNPDKRWYYDLRSVIKPHDQIDEKTKERINLVNEFLAQGCKKILEGEIDDMMVNKTGIDEEIYQIPGMKGNA